MSDLQYFNINNYVIHFPYNSLEGGKWTKSGFVMNSKF